MIAAAAPSPLWFASRGAGTVTLVLLTAVVALGVLTAGVGARGGPWPRFLSAELHRNLALFTLVFLALHVATAILDPYAHLGLKDAAIPFASLYRPIWLGLGVIAAELFLALILTSWLRPQLGFPVWRTIHWLAYVSWPVALLHSLGTGTDAPQLWSLAIDGGCLLLVLGAAGWRLGAGTPQTSSLRAGLGLAMSVAVVGTAAWAADGPLQPGWAKRAGTPPSLIGGTAVKAPASAKPSPTATPIPGLVQDAVAGSYVHLPSGQTRLVLTDVRDPTVQFIVHREGSGEGPLLAVVHNGQTGCIAPLQVNSATFIAATCGRTSVEIILSTPGRSDSIVRGRVVIRPV